ncbi:glycosyltransferase family A protein [Kordiimonas sp. SCSIO 12610]|uniref:glycosyltransferase family A protein n=1 Tax=Kordiimonas sp. SCSIO 12610 TaxID=2829597 RepID=UPI00210EF792|nr:glycosyltransferase family A protein [Kordiimonas sp. SCSIO 12610]UTW56265.1 glycosyltransferase family 2 protein [Kordiimonas sp. SCSIO 12610]
MNTVIPKQNYVSIPVEDANIGKRPMGVVIPGFGHPKFLAEAIISACTQEIDCPVYVVVVDDGCKFPETGKTVRDLMSVYPDTLYYFRQKNTRLPGARNAGVRFLLNLDETIESIYFLDADNRLAPYSLSSFRNALGDDPSVGWAYPDIGFFGLSWGVHGYDVRETAPDYSIFKHLVANISEAGSLVRTSMFEKGVYFDEDMRSGFEDWDFWLTAISAGFKGVRANFSGFLYRRRPESMLAEARREADALLGRIKNKHSKLFSSSYIAEREHIEAPAFAVIMTDKDEVCLFSDPLAPARTVSYAQFDSMVTNWLVNAKEYFFPQFVLAMSEAAWNTLQAHQYILRSLFWRIRSNADGFEYYRIADGLYFDISFGLSSVDVQREADFACISASVLRSLMMADIETERKVIGKPRRNLVSIPQLVVNLDDVRNGEAPEYPANFVSVKEKELRNGILDLVARHRGFEKPLGHADRRFAGPAAPAVRKQLMPIKFGEDISYQPYLCASVQSKRLFIAVHANSLLKDQYKALLKLLDKSSDNFDEVMVGLDHEETIDLKACNIPIGDYPQITDIYTHRITNVAEEYRAYLERKIKLYFQHGDIYESSLVMRNAGAVIMLGDTAFLEVHGEARKNGAVGYLWLEPEFFENDEALLYALHKALAFEHALQAIISDDHDIKARLSAYGVPSDKIITTHDMFLDVFAADA